MCNSTEWVQTMLGGIEREVFVIGYKLSRMFALVGLVYYSSRNTLNTLYCSWKSWSQKFLVAGTNL